MHIYSDDSFTFIPPEREPIIPLKEKKRAQKAIMDLAASLEDKNEGKKCCGHCFNHPQESKEDSLNASPTDISQEMQKASNQGFNMVKKLIFPSLPAVLQDLWVYLELLISIVAFAFGLLDIFPIEDGSAFSYAYFGTATITMILSLIDGFVYFVQLGSCARAVRHCRRKLKAKKERATPDEELQEESNSEASRLRKCQLSKMCIQRIDTWFELGRNVVTELLVYPLIIFDLFDFIIDAGYQPEGHVGRTDFSLFVIGGFYLILAVYIMRIFMVAGSMISLIRIPADKATGGKKDTLLLIKFCLHILGQMAVHLVLILTVAVKINNEFPAEGDMPTTVNLTLVNVTNNNDTDLNGNTTVPASDTVQTASPFLYVCILLGGFLPLLGIPVFFIVNYYWMKEFSVGFWLNMVSLLQGESFAEAVFGGDGLSVTKEKALDFIEKSQYKEVKRQYQRFKMPSIWTKLLFPTRLPLIALSGFLYNVALIVVTACLMLTVEDGSVTVAVFKDDNLMTSFFVIFVIVVFIANIHILILFCLIIVTVVLAVASTITFAILLSPIVLLIYVPTLGCLGYCMIFREVQQFLGKRYKRPDKEAMAFELQSSDFELQVDHGGVTETAICDRSTPCKLDSSITREQNHLSERKS